jgi:hypothetical protein
MLHPMAGCMKIKINPKTKNICIIYAKSGCNKLHIQKTGEGFLSDKIGKSSLLSLPNHAFP